MKGGLGAICFVLMMALLPGRSVAVVDNQIIPVQVVFNGSGTYTADESYDGGGQVCDTHNSGTLTWVATYDTNIRYGKLENTAGALASSVGPGNLALTKSGSIACNYLDGGCSAALQAGGTPQLTVVGQDPVKLQVQSLTQPLSFGGCQEPDNRAYMGRDVFVLNQSLPDATTAIGSFPATVLTEHNSNVTIHVDSGSAPAQVPSSCAGIAAGTGNISCTASLQWSGTIMFRVCGSLDESTWLPYCLGRKKQEAKAQADLIFQLATNYNPSCPSDVSYAVCKAAVGTGRSLIYAQADDVKKIAKDPPDARFAKVAAPHPVATPQLAKLQRALPAYARWATAYARALGYENALCTALNRQTGAARAVGLGNSGAAAAGQAQQQAIFADAMRAAALLRTADRLAPKAGAELGHLLHRADPLRPLVAVQRRVIKTLSSIGAGLPKS
ncbi:MAG TPA: hypothetical protein VFN87_19380 [Solirubrobacteraceae bacterium]|nr:hypothetical protein [Solirubrobacteraceae bacterium]